jgi:hypothetical protein
MIKPPMAFVRQHVFNKIADYSLNLVVKSETDPKFTDQMYRTQQFPAGAVRLVGEFLDDAVAEWERIQKENSDER